MDRDVQNVKKLTLSMKRINFDLPVFKNRRSISACTDVLLVQSKSGYPNTHNAGVASSSLALATIYINGGNDV